MSIQKIDYDLLFLTYTDSMTSPLMVFFTNKHM
jgi:hypothetical protein